MLTERQMQILCAVVDEYIASAEPVGSRTVSKKKEVGFSAATIRNEMADLEDMGYLEQPYTSAGRIPSQKGYRFYVDHILMPHVWEEPVYEQDIHNFVETDICQIATFLSRQTNYMTISLGPKVLQNRFRHLQVVTLSDRRAVAIIVTESGRVYQQKMIIPEEISMSELERIVNLINHVLKGEPLASLRRTAYRELSGPIRSISEHWVDVQGLIAQLLYIEREETIYTSGTTRILEQPEFQDINKMKALLDLLEETTTVVQLVQPSAKGVRVRIGEENLNDSVNDCSIISASILVDGEPIGTVGVLGPTRMDYRKVIRLIYALSRESSGEAL